MSRWVGRAPLPLEIRGCSLSHDDLLLLFEIGDVPALRYLSFVASDLIKTNFFRMNYCVRVDCNFVYYEGRGFNYSCKVRDERGVFG